MFHVFVIFCFLFCAFLFFVSCFVFFFWGGAGFKGQVRRPEGAPHLALDPPDCFFMSVVFLSVLFLGGFKGQVRWPEGLLTWPLNPPFFVVCLFVSCSF